MDEKTIFCQLGTPEAEQYGETDNQIKTECHALCVYNTTNVTAYVNGMPILAGNEACIHEMPGCMYVVPFSLRFASVPTGLIYVQRIIRTDNPARV